MIKLIDYINYKYNELESQRKYIQDEIEFASLEDRLELIREIKEKACELNGI